MRFILLAPNPPLIGTIIQTTIMPTKNVIYFTISHCASKDEEEQKIILILPQRVEDYLSPYHSTIKNSKNKKYQNFSIFAAIFSKVDVKG